MNLHSNSNSPYISQGGTLSFSNLGQLEILLAMVERDASLRSTARGYSMYPFIRDKDVLTISPLRGRQLKAGDVVAFTQNNTGRLAIHRIIEKKESGWLIRGDNCFEPDGVIPDEKVIGIVTRVERAGRDIRLAIGKAAGVVAFLNRNSALQSLKQIWMMPRLIASRLLAFAQSLSLYRALACRIVPPLDIVEANEDDMEAVHDAFNPFSPYRREKPNPNVLNLVARAKGNIRGFVQLVYHPADHAPWLGYWLFSLQVWPRYRGMGTGSRLTRLVIEEAKTRGAGELFLVVNEHNRRAIRFYSLLGFEKFVIAGLEPIFEKENRETGQRRIVMRKTIGDSE